MNNDGFFLPDFNSARTAITEGDLQFGVDIPSKKKENVARAAQMKQMMLGAGQNFEHLATAVTEGNDLGLSELAQELAYTPAGQLGTQYGSEIGSFAAGLQAAMERVQREADAGRSLGEVAQDTGLGVTAGAAQGLGGLAALGTGLIDAEAGEAVSEFVGETAGYLRDNQSPNLNRRRELGSIRGQLDQADINADYVEDLASGDSDLMAGLKRFGREFMTKAGDLADNPALAGDLVAEGGGSLVASGGIAGVLRKAATKVAGVTLSQTATTTAGIALLEGGGAYQQVVAEIAQMSEADLMEGAPAYVQMRDEGLSHEEARSRVANMAGQEAALIQGAIGAATGRLVAKFEANPLSVGSGTIAQRATSAASNLGKEAVEEGIQEASAGIVTDVAIRDAADPDRDVLEGAGADAATGVAAGAGIAAAVQTPGVAVNVAGKAAEATAEKVKEVANETVAKVEDKIVEESDVGSEPVEQASVDLVEVAEKLKEVNDAEADLSPEAVGASVGFSGEELTSAPQGVQNLFEAAEGEVQPRRASVMGVIAETIEQGKGTQEDRNVGALWVAVQMKRLEFVRNLDTATMNDAQLEVFGEAQDRLQVIESSPKLKSTIENAIKLTSDDITKVAVPTAENIQDPKVQESIKDHTLLAQINPGDVDPEFIRGVLKQRRRNGLTAKEVKVLENAAKLAEQLQEREAKQQELYEDAQRDFKTVTKGRAPKDPSKRVSDEVREIGRNRDKGQISLSEHQSNIVAAMYAGDVNGAQVALDNFRNWGQSYQNRLEAARASHALGRSSNNVVSYDVWDGSQFIEGAGKVYISPHHPSNIQTGKEIALDAAVVANTYNDLLAAYEELTGSELVSENVEADFKPRYQTPTTEEIAELNRIEDEQAAPKKRERKLRKDALLKPKESLIDYEDEGTTDDVQGETEEEATSEETDVAEGGVPSEGETDTQEEGKSISEIGSDRFRAAYLINPENSQLVNMETPVSGVLSVLEDFGNNTDLLQEVTDEEGAGRMATFIRKYGLDIAADMNARLSQPGNFKMGKKKLTPLEALATGDFDFAKFTQGKALNIVDSEAGTYDPRLLGSAVLAALHWVQNEAGGNPTLDEEQISKILQKKITALTAEEMTAVRTMIRPVSAKESLARVILDFWGVDTNDDVSMSDTLGIAQGVAAELLTSMEGRLITVEESIESEGNKADALGIRVGKVTPELEQDIEELSGDSELLAQVWVPKAAPEVYIDRIPESTDNERQKGNWLGEFSGRLKKSLTNHRKKQNFRNTDYLDVLRAVGKEEYVKIMGGVNLDPELNNTSDVASAEGRMRGLQRSYEKTLGVDEKVAKYAALNDRSPEDVPVYYDYFVSTNERTMAKGHNGQSDKTMRQSYSPTGSTLDLSDESTRDRLWLAIAQMSDAASTEAVPRGTSVKLAKELMEGDWRPAVSMMEAYLLGEGSLDGLAEAIGEPINDHALDSIIVTARYNLATKNGTDFTDVAARSFKTFLALEADGKTDGPFHAMVHFITKPFTASQITAFQRGGLFLNRHDATLNQFLDKTENGANRPDLYQKGSQIAQAVYGKSVQNMDRDLRTMNDAVMRMLGRYAAFEVVEEHGHTKLKITRNGMKNPLTIKIYGSSENGIAAKLAHEVMRGVYSDISDVMKRRANGDTQAWLFDDLSAADRSDMMAALELVVTLQSIKTKDGRYALTQKFKNPAPTLKNFLQPNLSMDRLRTFRFDENAAEYLTSNLNTMVVKPMVEAVHQVTEGAIDTTLAPKVASNIQSTIVMDLFKRKVAAIKEERGEAPTLNEIRKIYREISPFSAVIETQSGTDEDAFHLNLSGKERSDIGFEVGRSFTEKYRGPAYIPGPSKAGVSFMPLFTISQGDAAMMTRFFAENDIDLTFEQVFDGLNMSIDKIDTASILINKANAEAILANPMEQVSLSFEAFTRRLNVDEIPEDVQREIVETAKDEFEQAFETVDEVLTFINDKIKRDNLRIQARKNVLSKVAFSLDHMASGENPYNHEGEFIEAKDNAELATKLNVLVDAEIQKLELEQYKDAAAPVVATPEPELAAAIEGIEETNGVRVMDGYIMEGVLNNIPANKNQKALIKSLGGALTGWKVVVGNASALDSFRARHFGKDSLKIDNGLSDTNNKVMYVSNLSTETVLHEMLHAALAVKIEEYYLDDATTNKAAQNLEKLMDEFVDLDFSKEDSNVAAAAAAAKEAVLTGLNKETVDGKAEALHEFIAWTMTNQNLERSLGKVKASSKLARLAKNVLTLVRRLVGIPEGTPLSIFGNVQWNTLALLNEGKFSPARVSDHAATASAVLHQRLGDERLRKTMNQFDAKISVGIQNMDIVDVDGSSAWPGQIASNVLAASGINLTPEQDSAFKTIQTVMQSEMDLNGSALVRAQKVFRHFLQNAKVEDFAEFTSVGQAEKLVGFLTGESGIYQNSNDKSKNTLMANFVALSQVHPVVRQVLEKQALPDSVNLNETDLDEFLYTVTNRAMDRLAARLAGDQNSGNLRASMDVIAHRLSQIEQENLTRVELEANSLLNKGDAGITKFFEGLSDKASDFRKGALIGERGSWLQETDRLLRASVDVVAATMSEKKSKILAKDMISVGNKIEWAPAQQFIKVFNEVIGITDDNAAVYEMINRVKSMISALRQHHREQLPQILQSKFSRELDEAEWQALHKYVGQADLAALKHYFSDGQISTIFRDSDKLKAELEKLEGRVRNNYSSAAPVLQRAKDLGAFLVTGVVPQNNSLMKNALTIHESNGVVSKGNLSEVDAVIDNSSLADPTASEVLELDALITLYALDALQGAKPDDYTLAQEIFSSEPEGTAFVLNYITTLRARENNKAVNGRSLFNGWKGWIPSDNREGYKLVVAPESQRAKYERLGYTQMGTYTGNPMEKQRMSYFFSRVGDNAQFNQGAMQTVQTRFNGVDMMSGRDLSGRTAGMVDHTGSDVFQPVRQASKGEGLIAVRNMKGRIVGWERSIQPEMRDMVEQNNRLDEMLGAWSGRHAEEQLSQEYNSELVKRIHGIWEDQKDTRADEFVNLADPDLDNEIWKDAWDMIPRDTKNLILSRFGSDGFMIRKDMIDNTVGYRNITVGEAWTGPTRMNDTVRESIQNMTTAVMGKNAYRWLVNGEKGWQAAITTTKQLIVIKSFIVPASNIASNAFQLMLKGVPVRDMAKATPRKLVEIEKHLSNEKRRIEITTELAQFPAGSAKHKRLVAEAKTLRQSSQSMSIWPLIEAGEFSTISEGITDADQAILQGKWADWMNAQLERIPQKTGTIGRYAFITQDTALFQGMSRAVQYGDFIAKAVLYDHMTKRKKMSHDATMKEVQEEFVNYNLLPSSVRSYTEQMGLAWFWAFKLRSIKVAHRHIRDNPLRALVASIGVPMVPEPLGISVGAPLHDNAVSVAADGRAGYSLGLGMFWRSPSLNPWLNIFN